MRALGNRHLAWSLAFAMLAFLYLPLLVMAAFSFNDSSYTGLPFTGLTIHWYTDLFENDQIVASIGASVYVALGVVALSTLFGLPAAIALDRHSFPFKDAFRRIVLLPIALPGVITGVSLLLFYMLIGIKLSLNTIILGQGTLRRDRCYVPTDRAEQYAPDDALVNAAPFGDTGGQRGVNACRRGIGCTSRSWNAFGPGISGRESGVITIEEVRTQIEKHCVQTVILAGTDPSGVQRGKRVSVPYFLKCYEDGINFSSYIMTTTTMDEVLPGVFDTGIPDVRGIPDLTSFRIAPWEDDTAICLMDWHYPDGRPHPLCPRGELKSQVARLHGRGYSELFSLELEFYLFRTPRATVRAGGWATIEPSQKDIHCYSVIEGFHWESVVSKIRASFGEQIEGCMPEWGPGQFEINLYRSDAISMADTAVIFKIAVKEIAAKAGFSATFMAKWHEDHTGSSGHIHQSLRDAETGGSVRISASSPIASRDRRRPGVSTIAP